jgi:hypothetical protein
VSIFGPVAGRSQSQFSHVLDMISVLESILAKNMAICQMGRHGLVLLGKIELHFMIRVTLLRAIF